MRKLRDQKLVALLNGDKAKHEDFARAFAKWNDMKLDRRDTVDIWRAGFVYAWNGMLETFLQLGNGISVRPGESLKARELEFGNDTVFVIPDR